jgi:hypothetical protein
MLHRPTLYDNRNALSLARKAQGQIPHANGFTHNCFAKSSGISVGPCTILHFSVVGLSLSTQHGAFSVLRVEEHPVDIESSCEYIE